MAEQAIAWLVRGNRKVRYRGVAKNDHWQHHRAAALSTSAWPSTGKPGRWSEARTSGIVANTIGTVPIHARTPITAGTMFNRDSDHVPKRLFRSLLEHVGPVPRCLSH
jgi:hypothetical protein